MNSGTSSKKLKEVLFGWPYPSWVGSYGPSDKLDIDPSKAILKNLEESNEKVVITAQENNREVTTVYEIDAPALRKAIVNIKDKAMGLTLNEVGELEINF